MPMAFAVATVNSASAMHRNCSLQARFSQPARLTHPVSRRVTSVVRCEPSNKDDAEKDALVKEAVKQLRKADVDQASAREMMKLWKENGVTEDPEELRKLYKDRGNTAIARFTVQLALDALACFAAYQAAVSIDANADFFGKPVLVFLFSAVAFNYVLAFLSNLLSLGISVNSMMRFGTNAAAYLEAVKEIAGPTSLDSVTKVQSAIDSYKIARSLEKMDTYLKERAVEVGGKMATMESLAVYFILNEARDQLGFAPEEYGLSDDDAVTIARMFAKYDANGDGRIDSSELRSLCTDAGKTLTEEETEAALQAIDDNNNGVIEFNEFVGFWVNPSKYVTELKTISEAEKKDEAEGEKAGQDKKQPVASVSNK